MKGKKKKLREKGHTRQLSPMGSPTRREEEE
jgi:hypothetical protein